MNTVNNNKAPARTGATEKDCMYENDNKPPSPAQAAMHYL
jgi:hypothetical protein